MKRNQWLAALKDAMQTVEATKYIDQRNAHESRITKMHERSGLARPIVVWTQRVKLTHEQKATLARMCGFEGNKGFGWTILSPVWSFEEQVYAVVCQAPNGTYGVVYPNGEVDQAKGLSFRHIGDWSTARYVPVAAAHAPVERAPENFPSHVTRVSNAYSETSLLYRM